MIERSGVFILSASNYSAYSITVLKLLLDHGIPIRGVMVHKLVDRNRMIKELRRSGLSIAVKIFRKLILQRLGVGKRLMDGFSAYYKTLVVQPASLLELSKQYDIPIKFTSDFHASDSLQFVEDSHCVLVVFTGGGLIRQPLIDRAGLGVLNCHMGILPKFRGMDCIYWCSLNRDLVNMGFTVHLMDNGVDTGPIYKTFHVDVREMQSLDQVAFEIEYKMAPAMVDSIYKIMHGEGFFTPQNSTDGKQYYTISPECKFLAHKIFKKLNN